MAFHLLETTIDAIQAAYRAGELSARDLVQLYLNRIEVYDKQGPNINAIITIAPDLLEQADRLDAAYGTSGPVGPLHGVPVILKDQLDAKGTPTTLGSILLKDYYPDRDAFVTEKLRRAGAIILGKATLGELGGGDTHGTLFGSTRNPWDLERTAGGSSGGTGAAVSANFAAIGIGQEGFASIRRPAAWNGIAGSLGPMARTVRDLAILLDVMVGYDPEDPITALGVGKVPATYTASLDPQGLQGARIGVIRESMGRFSEPGTEDFEKVARVFDAAVADLEKAGATLVDPVVIPHLNELLAQRTSGDRGGSEGRWDAYYRRSAKRPFNIMTELLQTPGYKPMGSMGAVDGEPSYEHLQARETLMFNIMKAMADHQLDAIVHRSVEHQPTLIRDGVNPPFVNTKGVTHINTFLVYVSSMSVPAGYTSDGLPVGITFLGRGYDEPTILKLAYAYEQATMHRTSPATTRAIASY